jgi:hypothetical protein
MAAGSAVGAGEVVSYKAVDKLRDISAIDHKSN